MSYLLDQTPFPNAPINSSSKLVKSYDQRGLIELLMSVPHKKILAPKTIKFLDQAICSIKL